MFVITVNYKKAPLAVREQYALSEEAARSFLKELKESGITEAVYLNTCNRCEIYGIGDETMALRIFTRLGKETGEDMKRYYALYEDGDALKHLFRVISGIESMVIGEDEVLGQMKHAYEFSKQAGMTGYAFNTIFQAAIATAKRIKTETMLSKSSVSVATLAADKARKSMPGEKTILVIGASGDTGRKLTKNLLSFPECTVYGTQRNVHVSEERLKVIGYDARYDFIEDADVIISATKSPRFTITAPKLEKLDMTKKPHLFIDLAIPRDIDEDVVRIPGTSLITIADIEALARENNELKMAEVDRAELMIEEDIDELKKTLSFHDFMPLFNRLQNHEIRDFKHFVFDFRDAANAEQFECFIEVLKKMESELDDKQ